MIRHMDLSRTANIRPRKGLDFTKLELEFWLHFHSSWLPASSVKQLVADFFA